MSFYSKDLYRNVALAWKGAGLTYLVFLISLCLIPVMLKRQESLSDLIANRAPAIVEQVPEIVFEKGEVSVEAEMPYYIKDPKSGKALVIIDTTGKVTSLEGSDATVLVMKKSLMFRSSPEEITTYDLDRMEDFRINRQKIYEWLEFLKKWLSLILYPVIVLFTFVWRILKVLVYAAIGLVLSRSFGAALKYKSLLRIASVASTPVIIVDAANEVMGVDNVYALWGVAGFVITFAFIYFAVKAVAGAGSLKAG